MSNDEVIDTLNDLIETCKDGEYGFRTSSEHAKNPELKTLLLDRANDCQRGASELQSLVVQLGGEADTGGSALGAMHRGWVAVKATLSSYDDKAILEECERGEDTALTSYRNALAKPLPPQIQAVVDRQYQGVKRNHDQVRELRNRLRAVS
ncbi:ferritin-like domain-containing protein [Azohydromonas caseinilytica]|uniref:PA2169 family four-helix-bundle protein n=1 Tax=Azohydromonas caseinilytica TaxID=2728836 RepID=A0A848F5Z6_9BURK|nr:PA2169 family four-helix-bundle protein [Azohydromonas caseinilytica]NML13531.1 PA2169 family four-helix-bundle protein [Azohydromonas caseinilytica]